MELNHTIQSWSSRMRIYRTRKMSSCRDQVALVVTCTVQASATATIWPPSDISADWIAPAQCTALLDPPRARFWLKLLVNAR